MTPPPQVQPPERSAGKDVWRRWALDRRRTRSATQIEAARLAITEHLLGHPPLTATTTICSYLPLRTEPLARALSDALLGRGHRVLMPVTGVDAPLQWAEHDSARTPTTGVGSVPDPGPALPGPEQLAALQEATLVLVPALLVADDGTRLGRGGGHYDRSFALTALGTVPVRMAVVFDDERVPMLPSEWHDVGITAVVSPTAGVRMLPAG